MRVEDLAHKSVATTSLPIEISNTAPVGKIKLVTGSYDPANDGPVFNTEGYQAITFVADGVKDPDGPPHTVTSYQWDFDGKKRGSAKPANTRTPAIGQIVPLPPGFEKQASGPWVVHKFIPRDKPYVVDLVLTDDSGGRTVIQKTVKAVKPVKATASFFVDQPQPYHMTDDGKTILRPGHKYKFNGASSSPSNASYFWSIYGNAFEEKSSVAYFDFPKLGSFTAKLRVETPAGKKNEIGLPIVVAPNKPPHAKIELVTEDPREGDVITFSAGQSSDPDSSLATFDPSFQPLIPAKFEWGHMEDNGGQDSPKFVPDPPNTTGDYFHDVKMSAGTHNMAVKVTDDEGASSVASLDINVKPPACGSSYTGGGMQIDVDHPGDDAQNCLRVTKEGSCKQTNKTCNYVQIDGPFTFNGLHIDPQGQVAAVDYLGQKPVDPGNAPCGKAIGSVQPSILQGDGAVSKGSFSLQKSQHFSWWLESDGTLGCVGYNPAAPNKFNGLDVAGISQPVSDGAGSYKWNFWIKLPAALGGTTSDAITSDTYFAEKRLRRSGASRRALAKSIPPLHVNAGSLAGGVLPLDDLTLDYDGADSFHISASAHLPAPADNIGEIAGGATVTGGSFVAGDLSLDVGGAGFPIGSTGVFLSKLNFGINLQNGTHFTGGARFDIGPGLVNGHSAVSLDSQVNLDFPAGGYWHVGASGNLSVIGIGPLANAGFDYASNGYVGVSGGVSYYPFKNVGFEAGISGAFLYPHFNIAGHGSGRVKWLKRGIDVNVSDIGLGACLEVSSFWHPGITVSYSPFDIDFFFHGCDLGDVTQVINPPPARQRLLLGGGLASNPLRARAAGTTDGFDVKGDQPGAIFTAFGQGGAPRITLTGPSGQTVTTPVSEDEPVETSRFLAGTDQETASSDVILKKPQKGHWTVKVESGPPVASARFVAGLTSTGVQAKVKGSGFKRTLEYKVTAAKLQRVRFLEVGKGATRLIGTSKPGSSTGTIPFTPTVGPGGDRKIVAEVDTSGSPGSTDAVTHYTAPKPTPPPATAPKITRKGGALVVTWDASPTASSYDLVVTLGDGTKIERRLTAKQHSLTIPVTRAATASATATVTPFDSFGLRGGPATRQVHGTVAKAVSVKPTSYVQFVDPKTTRPVDIPPDQQVALP
jgi:hypothetical protein